ncbi:MAG: hypothetical protein WC684_05520 [Hyphomicrobium sp.]|jgi:hypothetical protein
MEATKKPSPAEIEEELDEALKATFPASDPVAVGEISGTEPDRPLHRRPAKLDTSLAKELARNLAKRVRR